jgi:hypothetical protein
MGWQKASGYNPRAKIEASIGRYKRVIGDTLRSRTDQSEATEVALAAVALNRMLTFGRLNYVRIAEITDRLGRIVSTPFRATPPCNTVTHAPTRPSRLRTHPMV